MTVLEQHLDEYLQLRPAWQTMIGDGVCALTTPRGPVLESP